MKKFTLEIELGNDAMRTYQDIREVLQMVTKGRHGPKIGDGNNIRDLNGNTVGRWEITGE